MLAAKVPSASSAAAAAKSLFCFRASPSMTQPVKSPRSIKSEKLFFMEAISARGEGNFRLDSMG